MVQSLLEMANHFSQPPLPKSILRNGMSLPRFYSYMGLMKKGYEASQWLQGGGELHFIQFT